LLKVHLWYSFGDLEGKFFRISKRIKKVEKHYFRSYLSLITVNVTVIIPVSVLSDSVLPVSILLDSVFPIPGLLFVLNGLRRVNVFTHNRQREHEIWAWKLQTRMIFLCLHYFLLIKLEKLNKPFSWEGMYKIRLWRHRNWNNISVTSQTKFVKNIIFTH